ncbi:hypothetical protein ACF1BQ_013355 [Bradyrhizobium sp. RDT10]
MRTRNFKAYAIDSGAWRRLRPRTKRACRLSAAAINALNDPAVRKQLENVGLQVPKDKLAPEALDAWQKADIEKWSPMIKAANVKVD